MNEKMYERTRERERERERERDAGKIVRGTKTNAKNAHTRSIDWLETETNIKKRAAGIIACNESNPTVNMGIYFCRVGSCIAKCNAQFNREKRSAAQSVSKPKTATQRKNADAPETVKRGFCKALEGAIF